MRVTRELLEKLNACQQGLDLIDKYPDGAELTELANDPDVTLEDLYFARHYFSFNDEELKLYEQKCHIKGGSAHVLRSSYIKDSKFVYNSQHVSDSRYVMNSEQVAHSREVVDSINVDSGINIITSKNIKYSNNVADSDEISNSKNVINSSYINWSEVVNSSLLLNDCRFIYKGRNLTDCYFGGFLTNCQHCLFCNNISDTAYQVFNKSVTPEEFERIKEELLLQLYDQPVELIKIDESQHLGARFSYNYRFDIMFEQLTEYFYGWVGSLPQYDELVFFQLFFTTLK